MKKIIILVIFLISVYPTLIFGQSLTPDGKNWKHTGIHQFDSTGKTKIGVQPVTAAKIRAYDALVSANSNAEIGVSAADSVNPTAGSYTSRHDFKYESTLSTRNLLKAAGSNITVTPLAIELGGANTSPVLVDGTIYYTMVIVTDSTLLTTFQYSLQAAGNFTGDANSAIGIYSFAGSTFTKIGNTATDAVGTLWKASINSSSTVNLVSPVWLAPGKYAIMYLYNSSAQTTAPVIYGVSLPYVFVFGTGLLASFYPFGISNAVNYTDLPATILASAFYYTYNSGIIFGF